MHVEVTFAYEIASRHPVEPVMCVDKDRRLVPGWAVGPDDDECDD